MQIEKKCLIRLIVMLNKLEKVDVEETSEQKTTDLSIKQYIIS